jgi:acetoacetate decarboxylase
MSERKVSSGDDTSVTGDHATSEELAVLIEGAIEEVTAKGLMGAQARHAVVDRVMEQVEDPGLHAVVAGHVHARLDLAPGMSEGIQSSGDDTPMSGSRATSEELAVLIDGAIEEVTAEGLVGAQARHAVVDRVMEQVEDPGLHAVVAGHVHARIDLA